MAEWDEIPQLLSEDSEFCNLFHAAELANFSVEEQKNYFKRLDSRRNMKFALEYQWQKGINEGLSQGIEQGIEQGLERGLAIEKISVVEGMLAKGCDWNFIRDITGLDDKTYHALKMKYKDRY